MSDGLEIDVEGARGWANGWEAFAQQLTTYQSGMVEQFNALELWGAAPHAHLRVGDMHGELIRSAIYLTFVANAAGGVEFDPNGFDHTVIADTIYDRPGALGATAAEVYAGGVRANATRGVEIQTPPSPSPSPSSSPSPSRPAPQAEPAGQWSNSDSVPAVMSTPPARVDVEPPVLQSTPAVADTASDVPYEVVRGDGPDDPWQTVQLPVGHQTPPIVIRDDTPTDTLPPVLLDSDGEIVGVAVDDRPSEPWQLAVAPPLAHQTPPIVDFEQQPAPTAVLVGARGDDSPSLQVVVGDGPEDPWQQPLDAAVLDAPTLVAHETPGVAAPARPEPAEVAQRAEALSSVVAEVATAP